MMVFENVFSHAFYAVIFLAFLTVLLIVRVCYLIGKTSRSRSCSSCRTMLVFGSGGHTSEMLELIKSLSGAYSPQIYVHADTDVGSVKKIEELVKELPQESQQFTLVSLPRSREVKQSWITTIFTTFRACVYALVVVWQHKPDLILCNGPGTCIPICGAAFLYRVLYLTETKIMFVESICRVKKLSLSGLILYYIADVVLVQWKELQAKYPRTQYIGRIL